MAEADPSLRLLAAQEALKALLASSSLDSDMAEQLRPQHFITRENGAMVPLVALDELPATVSLRGVPRTLSAYDVAGMKALGTVQSQHRQYVVDGLKQTFPPEKKVVQNGLLQSKYATATTTFDLGSALSGLGLHDHASNASGDGPPAKAYGIGETNRALPSHLRNAPVRSTEMTSRPLTVEDLARNPAPGVKEFCSYWLRHGECDYAQQGCLYRHEMPLDPPTLEKLGLRDIPRWYREKHGLGSYLALSAQRGAGGSARSNTVERNWRPHSTDASAGPNKKPVTSTVTGQTPTVIKPGNRTYNGPVSAWTTFARNQSTASNTSQSIGPRSNFPPPTTRRAPPLSSSDPYASNNSSGNNTPRPGTRLVPANAETISARIIRKANEQLDLHAERDEREYAALQKYVPLIPQRSGAAAAAMHIFPGPASGLSPPSGPMTPPPSDQDQDQDTSSVDDLALSETETDATLFLTSPPPPPPPSPATHAAAVAYLDPATAKPAAKPATKATRKEMRPVKGLDVTSKGVVLVNGVVATDDSVIQAAVAAQRRSGRAEMARRPRESSSMMVMGGPRWQRGRRGANSGANTNAGAVDAVGRQAQGRAVERARVQAEGLVGAGGMGMGKGQGQGKGKGANGKGRGVGRG